MNNTSVVSAWLLIVMVSAGVVGATTCPELVGRTPGAAFVIEAAGTNAYLGSGGVLQILNVADPSSPQVQSKVVFPGLIGHIDVVNGTAYISWSGYDFVGRLEILDVSNPSAPFRVGDYQAGGWVTHQALSNGFAYLHVVDTEWVYRMEIVDLRSPTAPHLAGVWEDFEWQGGWGGVETSGGRAYNVANEGLEIHGLNDPLNPELLGRFRNIDWSIHRGRVQVENSTAYVVTTTGHPGSGATPVGLEVLNVGDPAHTTVLGSWALDEPGETLYSFAVEESRAYVVTSTYASGSGPYPTRIRIVDLSNPSTPVEVGALVLNEGYAPPTGMAAVDGLVFALDRDDGMRIVDVSDAANPTRIANVAVAGDTHSLEVADSMAYVAAKRQGFRVFDVGHPASPEEVGAIPIEFARELTVTDDFAYVVGEPGLTVIDIGDPNAPMKLGSVEIGNVRGVAAESGLVVGVGYWGLSVVDVSEPHQPVEVSVYDQVGEGREVAMAGTLALVTGDVPGKTTSGLHIVDVSDPHRPTGLGLFETPDSIYGVAVSGKYVFVVGQRLRVIDITDSSTPVEVASTPVCDSGGGIVYSEGYAIVNCGWNHVVDLRNPLAPIVIDSFGEIAGDLDVDEGKAYLATGLMGIAIYSPAVCRQPYAPPRTAPLATE